MSAREMEKQGKKILVVEDEAHIAEGLRLNLTLEGHLVKIANNGLEALKKWKSFAPDLIILDVMMPEIDGHGVLTKIRAEDANLPIFILSAKSDVTDKVRAFQSGVDDYLNKPFALEEFLLRVKRLLTRYAPHREDTFTFGSNRVDFARNKALTKRGERSLTLQELKILKFFFANPHRPLNRQELLEVIWGQQEGVSTRTVDNFMVRFRKYFEDNPKRPTHFESIRSVGYRFCP